MSEDKEKKIKQREKALDVMYLMAGFLVIVVVTVYAMNFGGHSLSKDPGEWGVFGDFFGGVLNPIFAFFSFALLLLNLHLQRKQLDKTEEQLELNREELAETRKELARAATAQEESKKLMDSQCETQKVQQFDSLFTILISQLSKKIEEVELNLNKYGSLSMTLYQTGYSDVGRRQKIIKNAEISSVFIFLYQILKYINESFADIKIKKRYSNIVRSLIPDKVLKILIINCYVDTIEHNFHKYKELLEIFSFFEHMTLYCVNIEKTIILLRFTTYYEALAFGQHQGYCDFRDSLIFQSEILKADFQNSFSIREVIKKIVLNSKHIVDNSDQERLAFVVNIPGSTGEFVIKVLSDISQNECSGIQINSQWVTNFYIKKDKIIFSVGDLKFESILDFEGGKLKFITD